jgi:single-strand DNA-binding protein
MNGLNKAEIIGHIGQDPKFANTKTSGKSVVNFSVATNFEYVNQTTKQTVSHTEWHHVVAWGKLAEAVAKFKHKGDQVYVSGRLQRREYQVVVQKECTDAQGNVLRQANNQPYVVNVVETRYTTEIIADTVMFLGKPNASSAYTAAAAAPSTTPGFIPGTPFIMNGQVVGMNMPTAPAAPTFGMPATGYDPNTPVMGAPAPVDPNPGFFVPAGV